MNFVVIPEKLAEKIENDLTEVKQLLEDQRGATGKLWLTRKEFMEACSIKTTKFYELLKTGKIETRKIGRKLYIHRSGIDTYFAQ